MNFTLTQERQMLQDTLRRYLREKYTTSARNEILESETGLSSAIWSDLAELGVFGAFFTEDQGGFGGAGFDIAVVFEELGRAGVVEPVLDSALLGGRLLAAAGKTDMVADLIAGTLHLAVAHGEPGGRYDIDHVHTQTNGDALTGRKALVMNAEVADHLIISARDGDTVAFFLVARDAPGLTIQGYPLLAGGRAGEVSLESTPAVPLDLTLKDYEDAVAFAVVAINAETLGAMETATALTKDYLVTRHQFGRPIGTFQALAHRMSDVLIELEQARSAVINAAGHLDASDRDLQLSASKNLIGRIGRLVAEETIQMHGGIAMTQEYELAHIAKRIVMADHRFGDVDHHLERFIALSTAR